MIKFIGYVIKYKANMEKLSRLEQELEYYKSALEEEELKSKNKNNALRQIDNLFIEDEKNGPIRTKLYNDIRQIVKENVEKKFADEILTHTSTNH